MGCILNNLVSVIITTYKGSETIAASIESVLRQSYSNIEILVIDDNGLGTIEQIKTELIVEKYVSVKYIAHKTNKNGSAARNTGIKNSHGEYICFLDDDDEYTENRIKEQLQLILANPSFSFSFCSFIESFKDGRQRKIIARTPKNLQKSLLLQKVRIGSSTIMLNRKIFNDVELFDESFNRHQDWELLIRVMEKYDGVAMKKIGLKKNILNRNVPSNPELFLKYRLKYLEKYSDVIKKNGEKQIYNFHYCEIAKCFYLASDKMKAKLYFSKCSNLFLRNYNLLKVFVKKLRRKT